MTQTIKRFPNSEREALLRVKGVGPTVVTRLEEIGVASLRELAGRDADAICAEVADRLGAPCWKNSPKARAAIADAVAAARCSLGAG